MISHHTKHENLNMEHANLPLVAKKFWNIVRVMYFMLRKGISKRKLIGDLNMMMKRGKIAGKAIHNLMFHHHHSSSSSTTTTTRHHLASADYEFSCSNSPAFPFHLTKRNKHHHHSSHFFACGAHAPPTDDDVLTVNAVKKVLEMLNNSEAASPAAVPGFWQSPAVRDMIYSELSSPALPGFGKSPTVRQLRITDSPFPLRDVEVDSHVDQAAEEFILKFYNELKKQNKMSLR
ncbi:unnamed protein product [Camellia sinensis]